jgi:hypothetical protein
VLGELIKLVQVNPRVKLVKLVLVKPILIKLLLFELVLVMILLVKHALVSCTNLDVDLILLNTLFSNYKTCFSLSPMQPQNKLVCLLMFFKSLVWYFARLEPTPWYFTLKLDTYSCWQILRITSKNVLYKNTLAYVAAASVIKEWSFIKLTPERLRWMTGSCASIESCKTLRTEKKIRLKSPRNYWLHCQ